MGKPRRSHYDYKINYLELISRSKFDAVVLGVANKEFLNLDLNSLLNKNSVLYNVEGILEGLVDKKL